MRRVRYAVWGHVDALREVTCLRILSEMGPQMASPSGMTNEQAAGRGERNRSIPTPARVIPEFAEQISGSHDAVLPQQVWVPDKRFRAFRDDGAGR